MKLTSFCVSQHGAMDVCTYGQLSVGSDAKGTAGKPPARIHMGEKGTRIGDQKTTHFSSTCFCMIQSEPVLHL